MEEKKWWAEGRPEKTTTHDFMVGFYLARHVYPKYGLTEEEAGDVRIVVAETLLGLTPYKDWLDAAEKTCRAIVKEREMKLNNCKNRKE